MHHTHTFEVRVCDVSDGVSRLLNGLVGVVG